MLGVRVPSVTPSLNIPGIYDMQISQDRDAGKSDRKKARRRGSPVGRAFVVVLIIGLLAFFAYHNMEYFSPLMSEAVAMLRYGIEDEGEKEPLRKQRVHSDITELLGGPEFTGGSLDPDAMSLNPWIDGTPADSARAAEERAADTALPQIQQALLINPASSAAGAGTGTGVDTARISLPENRKLHSAKSVDSVAVTPIALPNNRVKADPPPVKISGSMTLRNVHGPLVERNDLNVSMTVELFYDTDALREELYFKRVTLEALALTVVRRQKSRNMVMTELQADMAKTLNGQLKSGPLSGISIRDLRIERVERL